MKIKEFDLMEILLILRQKIKFGWPEFTLASYTFVSWATRIYTPEIIKGLHWFRALQVTLGISIFLTFTFIIISSISKVDWHGKKSEKGLLIIAVRFFSANISEKKLLRYFFIFDSFLLYIYSRGLAHIIIRWILLVLSQITISFMWIGIGLFINLVSWPTFLIILLLILVMGIIVLRRKIFKKSYA